MALKESTLKSGIVLSVTVSIVALILVMVLTQNQLTFKSLGRFNVDYLLLAAVITIIFWLLKSLKLQVLATALGGRIPFHKVFGIYLASAFVAHVTPSSIGGLPFQIYFLHKEGLPLGKTTALTVLDSIMTFIFFMGVTPALLIIWGRYLNLGSQIKGFFYLAIGLLLVLIIITFIFMFNAHLARTFINWLTTRKLLKKLFKEESLTRFRDFIAQEVEYFNEGIDLLAKSYKDLFLVIIYTILYWIVYLSLAPVLLKGLGLNIPVPPVILAQLVFNFIQPIIPTPGGSGGAELGFAYLFKFMVPAYLLGIFVAVWRFFIFYASLIVGGVYFIHLVQGTDYLDKG